MSCRVDDIAWLGSQALLSDRLMLVLLAGCALSLACLFVMVDKICWLLYDGIRCNQAGNRI